MYLWKLWKLWHVSELIGILRLNDSVFIPKWGIKMNINCSANNQPIKVKWVQKKVQSNNP